MTDSIRNIAIIAHVDHGKTTLVDTLLTQSNTKLHKDSAQSLIMDSNELERERGITIFAKNASVVWNDAKINIIDTPGHADFGGEVERVLKMADGCLLLIDAKDGPMPQTRFVLKKALEMKHKIIVVVNKIDMPEARVHHVLDKTLDLFLELGADDEVADFPIIYASAKNGVAGYTENISDMTDIKPIFETILKEVPAPTGDTNKPLQFLTTTLGSDPHKGRLAIGRIYNGKIRKGEEVLQINREGEQNKSRITSLMTHVGLDRVETEEATAGDIVAVAGIKDPLIGETLTDIANPAPLPLLGIEEPTIRVNFMVNSSPFAGKEGEFKTSRQIQERLHKEIETDMALKVENDDRGGWIVAGRGELHIAILIERMRREGYEFQIARPQVIDKVENGTKLTPYEKLFIEVPDEYAGVVMQKLGERRGDLKDMKSDNGITHMEFNISTKGLMGYRSQFVTDTRGHGIMNTLFLEFAKDNGYEPRRNQGSLIAYEKGTTSMYSLANIQDRGQLFVGPGTDVYEGQVVGQNARNSDMRVNVCKEKHLTNMRSKGDGVADFLKTPKKITLEDALEYISDDELVEITPQNIRLRKIYLTEAEEKRNRVKK